MSLYAIVEFSCDQTIEIIPTNWLKVGEKECLWPPYRYSQIGKDVHLRKEPELSWALEKIRVLGKADTYSRAREKLRTAEGTSDLQTDSEVDGKRKRTKRSYDSDDDIDDSHVPAKLVRSAAKAVPQTLPSFPTATRVSAPETNVCVTPQAAPSSASTSAMMTGSGKELEQLVVVHKLLGRILGVLQEVKQTQAVRSALLQSLMNNSGAQDRVEFAHSDRLPLMTVTQFDEFDSLLADATLQIALISKLADIGGRTVEECVRRCMPTLVTNDLALQLNLTGRKNKRGFGSSHLFQVIFRAVKRSPASASATQKELETSIAKWLTGARDRDGLRVNRQKSRSADPVAEEFVAVPTGTSSSLSPVLPMLGDNELELDEPNYE